MKWTWRSIDRQKQQKSTHASTLPLNHGAAKDHEREQLQTEVYREHDSKHAERESDAQEAQSDEHAAAREAVDTTATDKANAKGSQDQAAVD